MSSKRGGIAVVAAAALVAAIAVANPAGARTATTAWGSSCLDGNNNGACGDAADKPMAQATAGGYYNELGTAKRSGIVLAGVVSLPSFTYIAVNGDISIAGTITIKADMAFFTSGSGRVTVADNTVINSTGDVRVEANGAATSTIGNNVKLSEIAQETNGALQFSSAGSITVGSKQVWKAGGDYGAIDIRANKGTLTVAPGLAFSGPNHAELSLSSGTDLVLDKLTHKAGYLFVWAGQKNSGLATQYHQQYTLDIRNSSMNQTYGNGELWIKNVGKAPVSRTSFTNNTIVSKATDGPDVFPQADCTNTKVTLAATASWISICR